MYIIIISSHYTFCITVVVHYILLIYYNILICHKVVIPLQITPHVLFNIQYCIIPYCRTKARAQGVDVLGLGWGGVGVERGGLLTVTCHPLDATSVFKISICI